MPTGRTRASGQHSRKTHGSGSVVVGEFIAAEGPDQLIIIESTMNSIVYQSMLEEHVRPSVK